MDSPAQNGEGAIEVQEGPPDLPEVETAPTGNYDLLS